MPGLSRESLEYQSHVQVRGIENNLGSLLSSNLPASLKSLVKLFHIQCSSRKISHWAKKVLHFHNLFCMIIACLLHSPLFSQHAHRHKSLYVQHNLSLEGQSVSLNHAATVGSLGEAEVWVTQGSRLARRGGAHLEQKKSVILFTCTLISLQSNL